MVLVDTERMTGKYLQIVYLGKAKSGLSEHDFLEMQEIIVPQTMRKGISGVLLHRSGVFFHFLEGPFKETVTELVELAALPYHSSIELVIVRTAKDRLVQFWSMGVIDIESTVEQSQREFDALIKEIEKHSSAELGDKELNAYFDHLIESVAGLIDLNKHKRIA